MLPPHYSLDDLDAYHDFTPEVGDGSKGLTIYYSKRSNTFKMQLIINYEK